jgi:Do/DeqQ family serine protease
MSVRLAMAVLALGLMAAPVDGVLGEQVPQTGEEVALSFAPVVQRAAPAVVNVYATQRVARRSLFEDDPFFRHFFDRTPFGMPRERLRSSLGSGVIVDPQGWVVTNDHVIRNATEVRVALADGREYEATVLLRDESTDLAVLRIEDADGTFPMVGFADSDELQVGDLVLAIGNPFGVGQTVTSGIVSALARTQVGITDLSFFIQTDAAINPGNSGGPLVDMNGHIVGINTAIFTRTGGSMGMGFAIPSNMVQTVVAQAMTGRTEVERPWLGAAFQEVTTEIARSIGLDRPRGALIVRIDPESPAERAGLRVGDLVLAVEDRKVADPQALEYRLTLLGPGQRSTLQVLRRGERISIDVRLEQPPEVTAERHLVRGRSPLTGAFVASLSPALAGRLGLPPDQTGVAVIEVGEGSPAARFGLRPGDVVVEVQGMRVRTPQELQELAEVPQRRWHIAIDRNGRIANLVVGG